MKHAARLAVLVSFLVLVAPVRAEPPDGASGTVVTWGANDVGQLGQGNVTPTDWREMTPFNPAPVPSLSNVTAVAAGMGIAAAIDAEGAVWVWGSTVHAPKRDGATVRGVPARLPGLSGVLEVALGDLVSTHGEAREHGLALKDDGTVWAWGSNVSGELGREQSSKGVDDFSDAPVAVAGLSDVRAVAAGDEFSMALRSDGTVWAWGSNQKGQLGNGTFDKQRAVHPRPVRVGGLEKIVAIAVGMAHCLALDEKGTVWGWGMNARGALARPVPPPPESISSQAELEAYADSMKIPVPFRLEGLPKVKAISAKGVTSGALSTDGRVYAWGHHVPRRLTEDEMRTKGVRPEDNPPSIDLDAPFPVLQEGLTDVVALSIGALMYMALRSDGSVWAWGTGGWRIGKKDAASVENQPGEEFRRRIVTPTRVEGVTASRIAAGAQFWVACGAVPRASFLEWYVTFVRLLADRRGRVDDARAIAAALALPLGTARRRVERLNRAIVEAERASRAGEPTASREIVDRLKAKLEAESAACHEYLKQLDDVTADATQALSDVSAALVAAEGAADDDAKPRLARWKERYDAAARELPMEMALAAAEEDAIVDEVQKGGTESLPVGMRVRIGNHLLQRGELADAIHVFRSAVRSDPGDAGARDGLARAEAGVLRLSLSKSSGALAEARDAFRKLIDASGYADRPYEPTDWDWLATESWSAFTHLPVNLADIVVGRRVAEQTRLRKEEMELVRNLLVIPVVIRLRLKGHPLDEILRMTGEQIRAEVPLKTAGGRPYTKEEMNALGAQIHKAMAIGDFPLLLKPSASLEELRAGLARPYVSAEDLPDTWHNEFGAGLVENAVMLALPMARLGAGGMTVVEYLGYATRYEKAVAWFGGTETGQRLLQGLRQYHALQASLIRAGTWGGYARFANLKAGELIALMMVQQYAVEAAAEHGGAAAAAITSCLVMMMGDLDLLMRWLAAGRISKQAALAVMDVAIREGEKAARQIEENAAILARLRELRAKSKAGGTFSPEDTAFVREHASLDPDFVPTGDALHDVALPRQRLAQDASSGADRGASKACQELEKDAARQKGRLEGDAGKAKAARERLASAPEPAEPPPPTPTRGGPRLAGRDAPTAWGEEGGYRIPDGPQPGSKWAQAELAMRDGDYARAADLYRQAHAEGGLPDEFFAALQLRAEEALLARRRPLGPKQDTSAELPPDLVDDILVRRWDEKGGKIPIERSDPQAIGQVWRYTDATGSYIVKEVPLKGDGNMDFVETALVSSRLMDELGIPNSRVAFRLVQEGDKQSARLLIRRIEGTDMSQLTSGELYLYRKDLSEQRAFSLLIRDYDRKPPNSMLGDDGRVYYIDPDMGHMYEPAPVAPGKLEGRFGQDHWYLRSNEAIRQLAGDPDPEMARRFTNGLKTNLVERSLTANDAQPMVKRIQTLLDPANQAHLEDVLTRAYREVRGPTAQPGVIKELVQRTIQTMRDRAGKIPEVLQLLNERNGIPLSAP